MVDDTLTTALKENVPIANQKVSATSRAAGKGSTAASEVSSDWFAPLPSLPASRKRAASTAAASSPKRGRAAGADSSGARSGNSS
eukprot:14957541-Alexandrium_andersonii.AAC.1